MNTNYNLDQISDIAKEIISSSKHKILLFYGSMGSGKTTLIKEIVKQLDVKDMTSSPTFSLVNEYRSSQGKIIYHFDFYRIEKEEEAYDMGIEEYFLSDNWCFIEWPEKVENLLPLDTVSNSDDLRTIQIK